MAGARQGFVGSFTALFRALLACGGAWCLLRPQAGVNTKAGAGAACMGLTARAANLAPALAHFVPVCCRPVPSRGQVVNIVQQTTKLDGNGEGHCQSARSYRGRPRPMKLCGHACVPPCRPA